MRRRASSTCSRRAGQRASRAPVRQRQSVGAANQGVDQGMRQLRQADLGDRRHHHASLQTGADHLVLATHSNGISALQLQRQLALGSYKTAWLMCAKLRRSMDTPEDREAGRPKEAEIFDDLDRCCLAALRNPPTRRGLRRMLTSRRSRTSRFRTPVGHGNTRSDFGFGRTQPLSTTPRRVAIYSIVCAWSDRPLRRGP